VTGFRVVEASGPPQERGRAIGRALEDLIGRSVEYYHKYFDRRGVASADLQDLLAPYLAAAERHLPNHMATIKGMSEGAMVPVWELFAINAFEELEPLLESPDGQPLFLWRKEGYTSAPTAARAGARVERCSTFSVAGPGYTLLGHNEHWLAGDMGNVAVIVDRSAEDGVVVSPTIVSCLPAVGMNGFGLAQGINSLTASDDGIGVPRVLVSRHALGGRDRADAIRRAGLPARAGGYSHVFALRGGDAFAVETSRTRQAVIDGPGPHTNHYLDPGLAGWGADPSPGSMSRYERLRAVLDERRPSTPQEVMQVLRDHEASPQAVCLHPEEEEADEASAVLFSMVCDVEAGRMWVAPGNPCTNDYDEVDLSEVG
jgi:isopenicillin-N N-acyltransferase-like protein